MQPETGSRTLATIVGIALLVIIGGFIWYRSANNNGTGTDNGTTTAHDLKGTPSAQNENLIVYAPQRNDRVGTPLVVQGEARVFENVVNFRLVDASGKEIAKGSATANSRDVGQFGDFRGELNFISETDQQGTVEVYTLSAQDGSEINKLTIPVTITKTPEFIKG